MREHIQSHLSCDGDGRPGGGGRYDRARQIKEKQDAYCEQAFSGRWSDLGEFPKDLQWEALVNVLRGRVKVCYPLCSLVVPSLVDEYCRYKPTAMKQSTWMT